MAKKISGWGNYPKILGTIKPLLSVAALGNDLMTAKDVIAKGNSRSYGDSSLSEQVVHTRPYALFKNFDHDSGVLTVQAGVLLKEILDAFVPRGWFLEVTPGTKLITVGGAIASDVHGKNHHLKGCFSESVLSFELMQDKQKIISCNRQDHPELFRATCGGQGLTGIILSAQIRLVKINSKTILQNNFKTNNLKETIDAFLNYNQTPYSVAWIDCTANGKKLGRGHVSIGEFANDGDLNYTSKRTINLPFFLPKFCLNSVTLKLFNLFYFHRQQVKLKCSKVDIDSFFYPLDAIHNWNRLYGKPGFIQYQCVLPLETSYEGLQKILSLIADAKKGSFLAVLKLFGEENQNYLSFPMKGFTLALDFKVEDSLFPLLLTLDKLVQQYGGRIYLAKDARIEKKDFEAGYPKIEVFRKFRKDNELDKKFNSLQSKRLSL